MQNNLYSNNAFLMPTACTVFTQTYTLYKTATPVCNKLLSHSYIPHRNYHHPVLPRYPHTLNLNRGRTASVVDKPKNIPFISGIQLCTHRLSIQIIPSKYQTHAIKKGTRFNKSPDKLPKNMTSPVRFGHLDAKTFFTIVANVKPFAGNVFLNAYTV